MQSIQPLKYVEKKLAVVELNQSKCGINAAQFNPVNWSFYDVFKNCEYKATVLSYIKMTVQHT